MPVRKTPQLNLDIDVLKSVESSLAEKKEYSIVDFAQIACGKKLFPRQALLLKLIFLEDLTDEEEAILDYWIAGGHGGSEILISPMIRERIAWLKEREYPHFHEVVLVGGRRSSKGYLAGIIMAYKMYTLLMMDCPQDFFHIDRDRPIVFACIAASLEQAKDTQYTDFSSTVTSCEAMVDSIFKVREEEFSVMTKADKNKKAALARAGTKVGRDTSSLIGGAFAANSNTIRGLAILTSTMDEMAMMTQEGESYMTASAVYNALTPSIGQFGRYGLLLCQSSPYTKVGKFYERYLHALEIKDGRPASPDMFAFQYPSWSLYQDPGPGIEDIPVASPDWDPEARDKEGNFVYPSMIRDKIYGIRMEEERDPDKIKVENRAQWAEVLDSFLRPELVDRAFLGRPIGGGQYDPIKTNWSYPDYQHDYIAHLDPSSTTAGFGFALGHVEYLPWINPDTGEHETRPHCILDIVKRFRAADFDSGVVDYTLVIPEIMQHIVIFRPKEVSTDQFANRAIIGWLSKELRERDMQGAVQVFERTATNDMNWKVASVFRDALYQDLIHIPSDTGDCDWLGLEMKNLQQINTAGRHPRVDHPTVGPVQSKDCWSAVSQVCYALIKDHLAGDVARNIEKIKPVFGAQGGYGIGIPRGVKDLARPSGPIAERLGALSARERLDKISMTRHGTWSVKRNNRRFR